MRILNQRIEVVVISALVVIAIIVSLRTFSYSQLSDQAFWLSLASFYEKGTPLYRGAFDIKDPLFFWSMTGAYSALGRQGPFLLDLIYFPTLTVFSYLAGRELHFARSISAVASIILLLSASGLYYETFRTTLAGLLLIVLCIYSAAVSNKFMVGVFLGLLALYKLPYVGIGVTAVLLIPFSAKEIKKLLISLLKILIGVVVVVLPVLAILGLRGELIPYFGSIKENINYSQQYTGTISGKAPGFLGHIQAFIDLGISPYLFAVSAIVIFILSIKYGQKLNIQTWISFAAVISSVYLFLLFTAIWPHHFHILSIAIWILTLIAIPTILNLFSFSENVLKILALLTISILMIGISQASGVSIPLRTKTSFSNIVQPEWHKPKEATLLEQMQVNSKLEPYFARLGTIDDAALGTFLSENWDLVCSRYAIGGLESDRIISETLDCIKNDANFIVVSDFFYSIDWVGGKYEDIRSKATSILNRYFECQEVTSDSFAKVCYRISYPSP